MKKDSIEILAPAGNLEILKDAITAGADSVYFGGKILNARRNAANFNTKEIVEGVKYCHLRGKKAFLTLNTIFFDEETRSVVEEIVFAAKAGFDAIIVQDLGILRLIKEICPDMAVHASTQMSAHNVSDCRMLSRMGFNRIVAARELSKIEIERMIQSRSAEIEVFVHGALCMSVSGQCYFSSALGERSGNRGLCAQVCRLPFRVEQEGNHNLSLKDNSLIDEVNELRDMGVACLKIEGRMKSAAYVVSVIRSIIAAFKGEDYDRRTLKDVFSRSGFTKGYFKNQLGREMFGIRGEDDKKATASFDSISFRMKETPCVGIRIFYVAKLNESLKLTITDGINQVNVEGAVFQKAQTKSITDAELTVQLSKLGGTVYFARSVEGTLDEGLFLPFSSLNELRRKACDKLNEIRENSHSLSPNASNVKLNYPRRISKKEIPRSYVRFLSAEQISEEILQSVDRAYLSLFEFENLSPKILDQYKLKLGAELPRVFFEDEERIVSALQSLRSAGINEAMCHTLGRVLLAKEQGFEATGGFGLNIANTHALKALADIEVNACVLSPEISFKQITALGEGIPIGIVSYGYFPVMLTRNCPVKIEIGCNNKGNCALTDRKGKRFSVICHDGITEILNAEPIYYADKPHMLKNLDFTMMLFTKESRSDCIQILKDFQEKKSREGITRGSYMRETL